MGEGGGPNFSFYVQKTDGSAPVWLGEGDGQALSPDGRFVLALLRARPAAAARGRSHGRRRDADARARPDRRLLAGRLGPVGSTRRHSREPTRRAWSASTSRTSDGGPPRAVTGEGVDAREDRPAGLSRRHGGSWPWTRTGSRPSTRSQGGEPVARARARRVRRAAVLDPGRPRADAWRATRTRRRGSSASRSRAGGRGPGRASADRCRAASVGRVPGPRDSRRRVLRLRLACAR